MQKRFSVTEYDEITVAMDNVSTKKTNAIAIKKISTIATNVTSTALLNSQGKRVRDCYILHTVLLLITLLLIIIIMCYHTKRKDI